MFGFIGFFLTFCLSAFAVTDSRITLESPDISVTDRASILRGAEHFKNNCMSCHSLRYAAHNDVLAEANIRMDQMPQWPEDSWGGHPPPDLTLMARQMGEDWIYTYLHAYYQDPSRPTGYNNLVYPNTNMPNPFIASQGVQEWVDEDLISQDLSDYHWYQVIKLREQGSMSPVVFDRYVLDLLHFLSYVSDPSVNARYALAPWVLGYLLVLMGATRLVFYLYKRSR